MIVSRIMGTGKCIVLALVIPIALAAHVLEGELPSLPLAAGEAEPQSSREGGDDTPLVLEPGRDRSRHVGSGTLQPAPPASRDEVRPAAITPRGPPQA